MSDLGGAPRTGWAYLDVALEQPGAVLAFAHRGGAYHPEVEGLENTRAAFEHAVSLGYDYLETDVHVTRDGVLLAFHDEVLDRVTDGSGAVATLAAADVRRARVGGREQVPTMADLMHAFPDARFNIDLKSEGAVQPLADLIEAEQAHDRVLVGSFSPARLRAFRRATGGRVATSGHPLEVVAYLLLPGRLARLLTRGRVAALQVPADRPLRLLGRERRVPVVTRRAVRRAHAGRAHVHVWTIDDAAEIDRLLDLGVDGIFTDRTDVLREVLVERGRWRERR